jgi:hypothetical protein
MQFPPNPTSEIIIPSGTSFTPGNDVIGIGFQVPAELSAEGINAAMIFYNSEYSPSSTLPRVVYGFFGQTLTADPEYSVGLVQGFTWQVNPSISSPLLVVATLITGMGAPGAPPYTFLECVVGGQNHNQNDTWGISEDNSSAGNPEISMLNDAGTHSAYVTVPAGGMANGTTGKTWNAT